MRYAELESEPRPDRDDPYWLVNWQEKGKRRRQKS
jgi:hypothetical protein